MYDIPDAPGQIWTFPGLPVGVEKGVEGESEREGELGLESSGLRHRHQRSTLELDKLLLQRDLDCIGLADGESLRRLPERMVTSKVAIMNNGRIMNPGNSGTTVMSRSTIT